jgi:predicted acylesterase/phospholipase RssA
MTKFGLVLGAGGIRGCAHAGAIRVLREAGIPIDVVVGASVGSMLGLGVAAGMSTERIVRAVEETRPIDLFRFYASRLRPQHNNPISRLLLEAGAGKDFSDLELPFAVIATDIETGRPVVLDRGPVLPAVQASIALPFIARSVALDGRHYLDGGLLDTAPIPVARRLGADRVIAVCLGFNYCAPRFLRQRPWTQRWLERAGRQRRPVGPGLRDQIRFGFRLYAATYNPPLPAQDADVVIWPEFNGLNPNSIFGAQFCLEQGMIATREALPEIRSLLSSVRPSA